MSNVGNLDRIIRAVVGLALVVVPFVLGWSLWTGIVAIVGAVLVVTAAVSFCPIYAALGLSSKRHEER